MAGKKGPHKVTLQVGFEFEKEQINQVGQLLDKNISKAFVGNKSKEYFNDIVEAADKAGKKAGIIFKEMGKPFSSKNEAVQLVDDLNDAFKQMDNMLLSLQGNVSKTFQSANNTEALAQFKALSQEIDAMVADSKKITELFNANKALGNKNELKSQIAAANKEIDKMKKNHKELSNAEKKHQRELKALIKENNAKLDEKKRINNEILAIQERNGVSSQKDLDTKISDASLVRDDIRAGIMTEEEVQNLRTILQQLRDIILSISDASDQTKRNVKEDFDEQSAAMRKAEEQARTFKSILQTLGISLSLDWVINKLKEVVRYSYDYVKNLDKALTEISVVTDKTRSDVMKLTDTFIELSAKTGMAIDDIAQASTIFYQQGLDDDQVRVLSEYTALFAKISGETVQQASDQLTSALNGFGFAADQVGQVVDKMSVLAAYSAADINELATAMEKGASAAAQAGLSFDQYNAYLATMIEVTREAPENIGTSLKTIMARFQQVKEAGTSEDGETDVNKVETALKSVGIQLRDSQNQLRDLGDVLEELGPKWNSLDRNTQAYLGTVIAGTRQQSRFISLMQNWDRAMELTEASENSSGAAARMHAKAMDSLDASINRLINTWQKLISNIANGDSFKWLVDIGNKLLSFFATGNSFLRVVTAAIVLFNAKTLMTNVSLLRQGKEIKNLDTLWGSLKTTILGTAEVYEGLAGEYSKVTIEIEKQVAALQKLTKARQDDAVVAAGGVPDPTVPGGTTGDTTKPKSKRTRKSKTKNNTEKPGIKTMAGNITNLVGKIQTALMIFTTLMTIADWIDTEFIHTSEKLQKQADEAYTAQQEEIYKYQNLIDTYNMAGRTYDTLSRKVNKSTEEVEQLAEAAEQLAEAAPGAVIGYDANGNPMINMHKVEDAKDDASMKLYNAAMNQIGNIGQQVQADIQESAEKAYDESAGSTAATVLKAAGIITAAAGVLLSPLTGGTSLIGVKAGVAMLGAGAVAAGTGYAVDKIAIENFKNKEFKEKWEELISDDNIAKLKEAFSIMNNNFGSKGNVKGTSANQRAGVANYLSATWLESSLKELPSLYSDPDELEEAFNNLATNWNDILQKLGDKGLAELTKSLDAVMIDIDGKSYKEVEEEMEKVFKSLNLDLTDEQIKLLKKGFMSATYSGASAGIDLVIQDLESRKETALKGLDKDDQAYKRTEKSYNTAISNAKNMSTNELGFYDSIGMTDDVDLFNSIVANYGDKIKAALVYNTQTATIQSIAILRGYKDQAEKELQTIIDAWNKANPNETWSDFTDIDYDKLTDDQKVIYDKWIKQAESSSKAIEEAWASLAVSTNKSWASIYEALEKATDRVHKIRTTINSMNDGISYEELKDFNLLLDNINYDAMNPEQAKAYGDALDKIGDSMTYVNGTIYLTKEGLETLADIEETLIQNSIESMKLELIAKKNELEAQRAIIRAEKATIEYIIACNSAEVKSDKEKQAKKEEAQKAWVEASKLLNQVTVNNTGTTVSAMVNVYGDGFAEILTKWNKLQTALFTPGTKAETIKQLQAEWKAVTEDLNFESYEDKLKEVYFKDGKWDLEGLNAQLTALTKLDAALGLEIDGIEYKLKTIGMNLRKYGDDAGKAVEEYLSQLEKFLKLIKHIERETMNLEVAGILKDMKTGGAVIRMINQELEYTRHLIKDNEELYLSYEDEANSAAAAIREGFGDMVTFDPWGNYDVDMNKYNAMSDAEKELLDGLLEDYGDLIDKRDDAYKQYLSHIKDEIDLEQSKVDAYIKAEDELVEAIKQREQAILDNKLAAIDKEIEAINKAADARRKAREEEQEAEELSGLQVDLQRALMDSSGASASQILEIQKQIKDKQQEIADNSFDTMVEDMTTQLEEEKELEQKLFDERLEEMDWYWDEVDRIMAEGTDSIMETMQLYLDKFNQSSEIQQTELLKGWEDVFGQAVELGKTKVVELQNIISGLQDAINGLEVDEDILTDATINTDFVKRPDVTNETGNGGSKVVAPKTTGEPTTKIDIGGENPPPPPPGGSNDNPPKEPKFAVGDKVRSAEQVKDRVWNWVQQYKIDGKGASVSSVAGWGTWEALGGKDPWEVKEVVPYDGTYYYWLHSNRAQADYGYFKEKQLCFKNGGLANFTGPAWLDGTKNHPEAVLDAMQTKAFLSFTDSLAALRSSGNMTTNSAINIDTISFNVDSMSSVADGEKAFNAFVDRFKEIGAKQGISVFGTINRN